MTIDTTHGASTAERTAHALDALPEPGPTLHLHAQPADDEVLAAQQAFAGTHPWFEVHRLDARSHVPTIEVPDQVAAEVGEFACRLG